MKYFLLLTFTVYAILFTFWQVTKTDYEAEMAVYDLNKNGTFQKNEMTPELRALMDEQVDDLDQSLAPFTLFVYSLLLSIFLFSGYLLVKKLRGPSAKVLNGPFDETILDR